MTTDIRIHTFYTSSEAYNKSQTGYTEYPEGEAAFITVDDGDVILVPSEGVVGLMNDAWPVAFTKNRGELHHPNGEPGWNHLTSRYAGWTMETVAREINRAKLEFVDPATIPHVKPAPKRCDHLQQHPTTGVVTGCNTIVAESETNCGAHVQFVELQAYEGWDDLSVMKTLTCRNHQTARYLTKNPWTRGIHISRWPEIDDTERTKSGECKCPFSDLVVVTGSEA